ncbi:hypothetical protein V9W64_10665 [Neisseria leonii]|uniref:Uncharacterized protein n=1 Tax=Neisseria leonii TaxID=2995413 RepID=A0A9X4E6P2_9NEIS|nr:hypothetical protein [Neisseria sp. 51.81]MDD9328786.1 hypothetical protein [Neisseria sp. 51.81]
MDRICAIEQSLARYYRESEAYGQRLDFVEYFRDDAAYQLEKEGWQETEDGYNQALADRMAYLAECRLAEDLMEERCRFEDERSDYQYI